MMVSFQSVSRNSFPDDTACLYCFDKKIEDHGKDWVGHPKPEDPDVLTHHVHTTCIRQMSPALKNCGYCFKKIDRESIPHLSLKEQIGYQLTKVSPLKIQLIAGGVLILPALLESWDLIPNQDFVDLTLVSSLGLGIIGVQQYKKIGWLFKFSIFSLNVAWSYSRGSLIIIDFVRGLNVIAGLEIGKALPDLIHSLAARHLLKFE